MPAIYLATLGGKDRNSLGHCVTSLIGLPPVTLGAAKPPFDAGAGLRSHDNGRGHRSRDAVAGTGRN
jgi:hypothetical protein